MSKKTPVSELMSRHVRTLDVGARLSEARRLLSAEHIHHLPIVEKGVLVGMLSSRDLVQVLRDARAGGSESVDQILDRSGSLRNLMTAPVVTVHQDEPVERAMELVADGAIHSVLVIDDQRRLVGIVTDNDLLDFLVG